ncbi:hypothetical protein [Spirosoma areae]
MKMTPAFPTLAFVSLLILFASSCSQPQRSESENPPMPDFNAQGSDAKAIDIADQVMKAQGGRKNWDATHYLAWNFFGYRTLIWDKYTGNVRIENLKDDTKILINVNDGKGKVSKNGAQVTQADTVSKYLKEGKEAWINDSYWLVMPFKLKDSGLTLKYGGEDTTQAGTKADVLRLTFEGVGVTPQNGYKIYVDKQRHLVSQWAHFKEAHQAEPTFVMPWNDYRTYGKIKLSGDRGERKLTDIHVLEQLPESVFTSFEPVDISKYH